MYEEKKRKRKINKRKENKKKETKINVSKFKINDDSILKKIDWKKLGIKLGILFFIMLILIFIVARLNKYQKKENEVYMKNVEAITQSTAEYFKKNPLPKNIGDSVSLVLDEMVEIKLIEKIKNNQEKICNGKNSYVITTKISNEDYSLKIYLECPEKKSVVEKKIVCEERNCTIKK